VVNSETADSFVDELRQTDLQYYCSTSDFKVHLLVHVDGMRLFMNSSH